MYNVIIYAAEVLYMRNDADAYANHVVKQLDMSGQDRVLMVYLIGRLRNTS